MQFALSQELTSLEKREESAAVHFAQINLKDGFFFSMRGRQGRLRWQRQTFSLRPIAKSWLEPSPRTRRFVAGHRTWRIRRLHSKVTPDVLEDVGKLSNQQRYEDVCASPPARGACWDMHGMQVPGGAGYHHSLTGRAWPCITTDIALTGQHGCGVQLEIVLYAGSFRRL